MWLFSLKSSGVSQLCSAKRGRTDGPGHAHQTWGRCSHLLLSFCRQLRLARQQLLTWSVGLGARVGVEKWKIRGSRVFSAVMEWQASQVPNRPREGLGKHHLCSGPGSKNKKARCCHSRSSGLTAAGFVPGLSQQTAAKANECPVRSTAGARGHVCPVAAWCTRPPRASSASDYLGN